MAVLEITLLSVNPSTPPSSPALLRALQTVREALATNVHPTRSRFYQNIQTPNEIYILGIWPDLASHHRFLANSSLRDEILAPQEGLMEFKWGLHVGLGGEGREEEVGRLLADAKGLEIGRWGVSASNAGGFKEILQRQESEGKSEGEGFKIVEGWTVDDEVQGDGRFVRVRGWKRAEAGWGLGGREGIPEEKDIAKRVEIKVMRNLEEGVSAL